jgi:hypothetical protein
MPAICIVLCYVLSAQERAAVGEIAAIEQRVLDNRRMLESAEILLHAQGMITVGGEQREYKRATRVWIDGSNIRQDITHIQRPVAPIQSSYREIDCFTDSHYMAWSDEPLPSGLNISVRLMDRDLLRDKPADKDIVDPRMIGMAASNYANLLHFTLESFVGRPDRRDVSLTGVTIDGIECAEVRYTRSDGVGVRFVVCPSKGHSIIELETTYAPRRSVESVECVLAEIHGSPGVWFPRFCLYEQRVDGEIVEREDLKIDLIRANQGLSDDAFDLAGMDIPPGMHISRSPPDSRGELYWDGNGIIVRGAESLKGEQGRWKLLLAANSVLCSVAAGYCLYIYAARRRKVAM